MSDKKGLSILIPVFNYDIRQLANNLCQQGIQGNFEFEILCYDDGSKEEFQKINREISSNLTIKYKELTENIGRAKIRNLLAKEALFNNLLFLDCDSGIDNKDFLKNYSKHFGSQVVVGGRIYSEFPPSNSSMYLHWLAGKKKEEKNALERQKEPYANFMFNNILLEKNIYTKIQLDENISGYGHEDSKFGYVLKEKKIPVIHIGNPVVHVGLDDNIAFLDKTKEAVKNLKNLTDEGFGRDTKLYKTARLIAGLGLTRFFVFIYSIFQVSLEKNLHSNNPSLLFLDLYKLNLFLK